MALLSFEELIKAIEAGLSKAMETQMERLTEVTMSELPLAEKQTKAREIMAEKFDINAVLNQLKPFVEYEGNTYEYKPAVKTTNVKIGSTGKNTGRFAIGDRIKYVQDGVESPVYIVTESGIKNEITSEVMNASRGTLLFKLSTMNKSEAQFLADYEAKNGRKFEGYPGYSDPHWTKIIN